MPIVKCDYCGKEVNKNPSIIKKRKHCYCCRECSAKAKIKKIKVKCDYCGKEIEILPLRFKTYKKHFCSIKCRGMKQRLEHQYIDKGNHIEFCLKEYVIKFDKEDLEEVKKYRWCLFPNKNNVYCRATTGELMHRVIMKCLDKRMVNILVDHISHDTLDNRKGNLKFCDNFGNQKNKLLERSYTQTKYTYITKDDRWKTTKYKVRITEKGKRYYLGQYSTLEQAINVRNEFLKKHYRFYEELQDRSDNNKSLLRK